MRHVLHKVNRRPTSVHSRLRGLKAFGKDGMPFRRARLQLLWDIAEATLGKNGTPTPERLEALKKALMLIPLKELGLPEAAVGPTNDEHAESFSGPGFAHGQDNGGGREHRSPPITYLHIYEDANISLGIFVLPARAQIPLHNHPGMTVLSRILYGKMHVLSYDWKQHNHRRNGQLYGTTDGSGQVGRTLSQQEVVTVYDRVFTPEDPPAVLFPSSGGNIHQFTALTDCAVLDLLSPPYSTDEGRDCTYYRPVPGESPGSVVLENFEPPNDFVINSGIYQGVRVLSRATKAEVQMESQSPPNAAVSSLEDCCENSNSSHSPRSVAPPSGNLSMEGGPEEEEEEESSVDLAAQFRNRATLRATHVENSQAE